MNVFLWILQGVLAAVMMAGGVVKLTQGREKLGADPRMSWTEDFSDPVLRTIAALEVAGALGLILPWALDIAPVLTPVAALGVVALMAGAMVTHQRRSETQMLPKNALLGLLALVVAVGRFGDL